MAEPTSNVTIPEARRVIDLLMKLLSGPNGQKWLDTISKVLRGIPDWAQITPTLWCTVETGCHKSAAEMTGMIKRRKHRITPAAQTALDEMHYPTGQQAWSLTVIPAIALCGDSEVTAGRIIGAIRKRGGQPCPQDIAPALCTQNPTPSFPWDKVYIATERMVYSYGLKSSIWSITSRDGCWTLDVEDSHRMHDPDTLWVCLMPTDT
jgi:hypothetical protein